MNTTQIAAGAAKQADHELGLQLGPAAATQLIAIIQAAIEKAILTYGHHEVARLIKESAEQASED